MQTPLSSPAGVVYGVALNDAEQRLAMADAFAAAPYKAPPKAPVLYLKPRNCVTVGGAPVRLPPDIDRVKLAATIGLLFSRDLTAASPGAVQGAIGAVCLALDVMEPGADFYRPAIRQQCRDGFLPLGGFADLPARFGDIISEVDGREVHRWSLERLHLTPEALAAEISGYMTLRAGDMLLVGIASDAPLARKGQTVTVRGEGLPPLASRIIADDAA